MADPDKICNLIDNIAMEQDADMVSAKMRLADDLIAELRESDDRPGMAMVSNRMLDHLASVAGESELRDLNAIRWFINETAAGRPITRQQGSEAFEALARFMIKYGVTLKDVGLE